MILKINSTRGHTGSLLVMSIRINSIKCFETRDTKEKLRLNCEVTAARINSDATG